MAESNVRVGRNNFLPLWTLMIGLLIGGGLLWQWCKSERRAVIQELVRADPASAAPSASSQKYTLTTVMEENMAGMTCDQCDEMFQECLAEVDPDYPVGYEVCQILWDRCKNKCTGKSQVTRAETRALVKHAYASALSKDRPTH